MTPEQRKEELSKAYLHAVAARCGFAVGTWSQDHGCIDTTLGAVGILGLGTVEDPKLDIQLKATTRTDIEKAEHIAFKLEQPHYEKLRSTRRATPIILVILLLPKHKKHWVAHGVEKLIVRRCAYWLSLRGSAAVRGGSKVVRIPKTQLFSPAQLRSIMTRISEAGIP